MLAHLRNFSLRSLRPWSAASNTRLLSLSAVRQDDDQAQAGASESYDESAPHPEEDTLDARYSTDEKGFTTWLNREGIQFKTAHRARNWLGGSTTPFPLNRSFKPPSPVGDETRQLIYDQFMANPAENTVRALASLHGLSIARVDAILRLKGLEEHWKKGKQLQTGFQVGMEYILGVKDNKKATSGALALLSENAIEADIQYDTEGNDKARTRYQRQFWEPVPEGQDAVIPTALEKTHVAKEKKPFPVSIVERGSRPAFHFVDVGDSFVDPKVQRERQKAAEHRARVRARRRGTSIPKATS